MGTDNAYLVLMPHTGAWHMTSATRFDSSFGVIYIEEAFLGHGKFSQGVFIIQI